VLEAVDDEVQRFAACQRLDALAAKLLLIVAPHGRQKRLRQDHRVLDQIGRIEHQPAAARLAVQHRQAMRQAEHPGGRRAQAVGQVVAMVQKRLAASVPCRAWHA
jgi:hypothetical protein